VPGFLHSIVPVYRKNTSLVLGIIIFILAAGFVGFTPDIILVKKMINLTNKNIQ